MTQMTDVDLRELRDLILGLDKRVEVFAAETKERFNSIDQRFDSVEQRLGSLEDKVKAQDNRIWSFLTALILALVGLLAKLAFFPQA
jgi:hypothetical protein